MESDPSDARECYTSLMQAVPYTSDGQGCRYVFNKGTPAVGFSKLSALMCGCVSSEGFLRPLLDEV